MELVRYASNEGRKGISGYRGSSSGVTPTAVCMPPGRDRKLSRTVVSNAIRTSIILPHQEIEEELERRVVGREEKTAKRWEGRKHKYWMNSRYWRRPVEIFL